MFYPCDCGDCGGISAEKLALNAQCHWLDHVNEDDQALQEAQVLHGYLSLNNQLSTGASFGYNQYPIGYNYPYPYSQHINQQHQLSRSTSVGGVVNGHHEKGCPCHEDSNDDGKSDIKPIKGVLHISADDGSKLDSNDDFGSKDEYSPGGSEDININDGKKKSTPRNFDSPEGSLRKSKYSKAELKPDSTLPPVIRRRNRNRRKQLELEVSSLANFLL